MALSAMRARLGMGSSRMIVIAAVGAAGRTTGNTSSFSRALKAGGGNTTNLGAGFSKIRRFSDIAVPRLPEQITGNTALLGHCSLALYFGGVFGVTGMLLYLSHIASERRYRRERQRYPRYDGDIRHDDVLQFDDRYVDGATDSQDQLVCQWPSADDRKLAAVSQWPSADDTKLAAVSQWPSADHTKLAAVSQRRVADDRKLAQLEANIADLERAVRRFGLRPELAELRDELLHAGTTDESLEIRKEYDDLVEDVNLLASQWRSAADLKLAEYKRQIVEVRGRIQEVERKQKGL